MEPYLCDPDFTLYVGDVRDVLATLPDESVDCVATSPPFYALRDYGVDGQIGLEETPELWVEALVGVFRECRRVLKPTGTLWVECGESYAGSGPSGASYQSETTKRRAGSNGTDGSFRVSKTLAARGLSYAEKKPVPPPGLKPKDIIGAPWMLAFALRADGWWLRQAIIWHKPNCMPESATDRCTTAHSYVFLLSKQARYWFDADAIAEPAEWVRWGDQTVPKYEGTETASGWMQPRTKAELQRSRGLTGGSYDPPGQSNHSGANGDAVVGTTKNPRSVWTIPTQGYSEAHFATWPEALVARIIKAGCPEGGTVLDPFMGSGTTALVARKLGRKSVGVELNATYAELASRRLSQLSLLAEP